MMITRRILKASKSLMKETSLFNKLSFKKFSAVNALKDIVKQEIDHEEKNYEPVSSEDKKTFLTNSKFVFTEQENSTLMSLKKVEGNYEVEVIFNSRPPVPANEDQQQGQEGEEQNPENMCDFSVKVNKKGGKSGLLFDAVSMDTNININQVHISDDINKYYENLMSGRNVNDTYMGPDFSTLDEVSIFV